MNNLSDDELLYELFAHRIQFMDYSTDENFIIRKLKLKLIEMGYPTEELNNIIYTFYSYFNILITMSEIESVSINQHTNVINNVAPQNFLQQLFVSMVNEPIQFNIPLIIPLNQPEQNTEQNEEPLNEEPLNEEPLNEEPLNEEPLNEDNEDNDYNDMPPLEEANEISYYNPLDNHTENVINVTNLLNIILGVPNNTFVFEQMLVPPPQNNRHFMEDIIVTTDENTLNKLNIFKITKDMNENCTICMEEMNEDEEYFDINCKHIFHKNCLETYLKNYNHICPVCRNEIGNSFAHLN